MLGGRQLALSWDHQVYYIQHVCFEQHPPPLFFQTTPMSINTTDTTFNTSARATARNSLVHSSVTAPPTLVLLAVHWTIAGYPSTCRVKIPQVSHISVRSFQHMSTPTVFLPLCHFTKHGKTTLHLLGTLFKNSIQQWQTLSLEKVFGRGK